LAVRTIAYQQALDQVQNANSPPDGFALARLQAATRWRPDLADGWRLLSAQLADQDSDKAFFAAQRAIQVDGSDWNNWHNLALVQFQRGDVAGSRRSMVEAARLNFGFAAHYALGNLAEAEGDANLARQELLTALRMATPEGVQPAIQQLLRLEIDPGAIVAAAATATTPVRARVAIALADEGKLPAALEVNAGLSCNPTTLTYCDWAVQALLPALLNRAATAAPGADGAWVDAAQRVWNLAIRERVLQGQPPAISGRVLDGDFSAPWVNHPWSWRASGCIIAEQGLAPQSPLPGLAIRFDGSEPQSCDIAQQWLAVRPGARYQLSFSSLAEADSGSAGLMLAIETPAGEPVTTVPVVLTPKWHFNAASFAAPSSRTLLRLVIRYERPRGTALLRAPVWLQGVALQPNPLQPSSSP